jgi:hypothetical protein
MKILMLVLFVSNILFAQDFTVQKVSGNVFVQKGFEEKTQKVNAGDKLKSNDLIITDESAFIHLQDKNGNSFVLKSNSAVGVNYLRKMSLNDLILALTQEEIRTVPRNSNKTPNTAVYGSEASMKKPFDLQNKLGLKKINGAKQLAENGFVESAILAAKETFRKYPATGKNFGDRLYFADLIKNLGLDEEAVSEYNKISKIAETNAQKEILNKRIEEINLKTIRN